MHTTTDKSSLGWWQWFGGIITSLASVILIIVILQHTRPASVEIHPKPPLPRAVQAQIQHAPIPQFAKEDILQLATAVPSVRLDTPGGQTGDDKARGESVLRRFDEL